MNSIEIVWVFFMITTSAYNLWIMYQNHKNIAKIDKMLKSLKLLMKLDEEMKS